MLCGMCKGSQNIICNQSGKWEWYDCPACNHWGFRFAGKGNSGIIDTEKGVNEK